MGKPTKHLTLFVTIFLTLFVVDEVITLNKATNTCTYYLDADSDPYDSDIDLVPLRSKRDVQRTGHVRPDTSSHAAAEAAASATSSDSSIVDNTLMTSIASSPTTTPTPAAVGSSSPASATAKSSTQAASQKNEGTIDEDDIEKILDEVDIPEANITDKIKKEKEYKSDTDQHKYYRGEFIKGDRLWVDLNKLNQSLVKEHKMLSKSYRRAATIQLTFEFPFYGHKVTNITIATGGFLYTGDYVHAWLAATQYIAPLMANFDTSTNDNAKIRYVDNGTALVVEWEKVHLKDRDAGSSSDGLNGGRGKLTADGPFSFQVILHESGDIVFAYKAIPKAITSIGDKDHPVKVGLSDAYIIDRTIFFVRRKTIYEYHRLDLKSHQISNATAIYFKALATCNSKMDCQSCINTKVRTDDSEDTGFDDVKGHKDHSKDLGCMWCPNLQRCSDGMDRLRQEWLMSNCDKLNQKKGVRECHEKIDITPAYSGGRQFGANGHGIRRKMQPAGGGDSQQHGGVIGGYQDYSTLLGSGANSASAISDQGKNKSYSGHYQAGIVTISIAVLLVLSLTAWFVYAYFFPHSWSGQLLIKYRPSHWQWRRAEPRYTAASIHM